MRELGLDGLVNVRDLGGLPLAGGGTTRFGAVARSEAPLFLTARGWEELLRHGIRTLVDLRCPSEEAYAPLDGVRRVAVPVFEFDDLELRRRGHGLSRKEDYYPLWMDYCRPRLAQAVAAVADASGGGVLVHCHAGRDRTGIVSALLLALAGVPEDAIAEDFVASRAALEPRYEQELRDALDERERRAIAHHHEIEATAILAALDAAGDPWEYLLAGGASREQLERARARLAG